MLHSVCARLSASAALFVAFVAAAQAGPLAVVNVGAPAVNCVFNVSCTVTVTDSVGNIPLPGISGTARLQSRTYDGAPGAPAAGKHAYVYRLDLTAASGSNCVTQLVVNFGPISKQQYNGVGPLDDVFVVTSGGLGSVGPSAATKEGDGITFHFGTPVCPGATSYFFGLAANGLPKNIMAKVHHMPPGGPLSVQARAPMH
jgi:hypothetical protein